LKTRVKNGCFYWIFNATVVGLTENEYDHVFVGNHDGEPKINPAEAENWQWMNLADLKNDLKNNPDIYSHWIKIAIDKF